MLDIKEQILKDICSALKNIKEKKPLIEQLTNYVTINDCANVTLAIGASPVMGEAIDEVEEMVAISNAVTLNFGIINRLSFEAMKKAMKKANNVGVGVVIDPVGVGATKFRNETIAEILEIGKATVIKGNASEIMSLAGQNVKTKGVDSSEKSTNAVESAILLAKNNNCVVGVTGEIDIITDGKKVVEIYNQSELLGYITGTGCMITSLVASYLGANNDDPFISTISGILTMSLAGEMAANTEAAKKGIGSYRVQLMDNIYNLNSEQIKANAKIKIYNV